MKTFGASLILCVSFYHSCLAYPGEEKHDIGTLAGDVQNWAMLIQNYILQLAGDGIKRDVTQSYLDQASYKFEIKNGSHIVKMVKETLGDYFRKKKNAAERLAEKVQQFHDEFISENRTSNWTSLKNLSREIYRDSDIPFMLPQDLSFNPYFRQEVSLNSSMIKIADEVPRDDRAVIDAVVYTAKLNKIFHENAAKDPLLRWQYFGSTVGITRFFPGREWSTNFAGFYNDYDPRVRPWYIAATSGPKDVVIVIDCSQSMDGEKFSIAKGVAKTVINTLTKQDYVNVICARASHWDEVGKWHYFTTEVLSCQTDRLVPATIAYRKDLIEKIEKLKAGGTSELGKSFQKAFELLNSSPRTGCQSLVVFATDGKDTDGEQVRCGPGYYTRSGYVPGPICKYNWTKVWDVCEKMNQKVSPAARIFSYLTREDAEEFPGKLACSHRGSFMKLMTGENLISQMSNYFEFLSSNAMSSKALWTSPYLDAWGLGLMITHTVPVLSAITGKYIGVVGIDATLDEIENFLTKHQWGNVYSFLINDQSETVYHPRLTPSKKLLDDPIPVTITKFETDNYGNPPEFSVIEREMRAGKAGQMKITTSTGASKTYFYSALEDSEYSFAFCLTEMDLEFRRSEEPKDRSKYVESYFNLLKEYNSTLLRSEIPGAYRELDVREKEQRYPGLRISYKYSTIFLPPKAWCDPTTYMYDDNLDKKTLDAHLWINSYQPDLGCDSGKQKFHKGVRADVLITQPIERIWASRDFESINQIKWTNVGLRSGVFRTYPGHRSTRGYDPTKRPWYKRTSSAPHKTSISTPYMDAAGVGKINTISQAVFEGMTPKTDEECAKFEIGALLGGCRCNVDSDCLIKVCYLSKAQGPNSDQRRCATERVEAVTGLDILYDDFQDKTMGSMQASDFRKSCGQKYDCPDGEPDCETRCYLFDSAAYLVMDPDFLLASSLDKSKYSGVTLGKKEGEVMKHLVYKHKFFIRDESINFQGTCRITPAEAKVAGSISVGENLPQVVKLGCNVVLYMCSTTLDQSDTSLATVVLLHNDTTQVTLSGIPKKPEELDDYFKNRGPIPKFHSEFGCIQDVVSYKANDTALGPSGMITGNVSGPCMSGFYYVTALPLTNLYLLVIENWKQYKESLFYNFNCKITRSIVNSGAYRIVNGTCSHEETSQITMAQENKCPLIRNLHIPCHYTTASSLTASVLLLMGALFLSLQAFN